jgi:hypothetical protein
MNNYQFLALLDQNYLLFSFILISVGIFYYLLFRNYFYTILDPFFFALFISVFCTSIVFFLFFLHQITTYLFLSFVFSQLAFFLGLFIFKPLSMDGLIFKMKREPARIKDELLFTEIFFIVTSIIVVIIQLYVYKVRGIPLLIRSRLEVFNLGTGFGIFDRIMLICNLITLYLLFNFLLIQKKNQIRVYIYFILVFEGVTLILGGSKLALLYIGFVFTVFMAFNSVFNKELDLYSVYKKREKMLIILGFCAALAVISIQNIGKKTSSVYWLGYRFLDSGSIFWYGYPKQTYKIIDKSKPFEALFSDILGLTRIVPWKKQKPNAGLVLVRHHHPEYAKVISGPNMRHNIFGLVYFGFAGGILLSFIMGFIISFFRNYLIRILPCNFIGGILYLLFYINISGFETDPMVTLGKIDSVIIVTPIIFIVSFFIYFFIANKATSKQLNFRV